MIYAGVIASTEVSRTICEVCCSASSKEIEAATQRIVRFHTACMRMPLKRARSSLAKGDSQESSWMRGLDIGSPLFLSSAGAITNLALAGKRSLTRGSIDSAFSFHRESRVGVEQHGVSGRVIDESACYAQAGRGTGRVRGGHQGIA